MKEAAAGGDVSSVGVVLVLVEVVVVLLHGGARGEGKHTSRT